ncbi:MAG TPA: glycosyltransferase family 2 protein [Rhodanobacteraceae bacterium]|nr:glycosyltransferase family 2 protein [Rhodanobacteraceae bacterium]
MNDPSRIARSIAVVIPALDEERAIREVVTAALALCPNVIVVDDGSTDRTADRVADLPITLIRHASPRGKGEGLREGFRRALELGLEGVVTMDGDGQHAASDIPRLLAAATQYPGRIVIGARLRHRERQPKIRRLANEFGDWGISIACGQQLLDTQSGQRYYPQVALQLADAISPNGFVFEADILIEASRRGVRVVAVPIESRYAGEFRRSHFRPVRDLLRITTHVVWKAVRRCHLLADYRCARATPAIVVDPPSCG